MIKTPADVKQLGTIMGVWAHPDDESYFSAGLMAAARRNGQRVVCVTATKGEAGVQDPSRWPVSRLADIRAHELEEALHCLGVGEQIWLDYHDGRCAGVPAKEAVHKLRKIIEVVRPDTILTFGPDGMTGHPDHQTISTWAGQAAQASEDNRPAVYHAVTTQSAYDCLVQTLGDRYAFFFNTDKPPITAPEQLAIYLGLDDDLFADKIKALKSQASQVTPIFAIASEQDLKVFLDHEAFTAA